MNRLHYKDAPSEEEKKAFAKYLAEDEELILITGFSRAYLRNKFVLALAFPGVILMAAGLGLAYLLVFNLGIGLLLGLIAASVIAFLRTLHIYHAQHYLLTTRRVIIKKGLFNVQVTSALYDKITHLEVDQSFVGKVLLHHGTIIINTAGMNKGEIVLKFIDYPMEIKNLMERLINREREQFGMRATPLVTVESEVL